MIHVYAFTERLIDLPEIEGLAGARIERVGIDEIDAVFSRRAGASSEALRRDALAHGVVVEALRPNAAAVIPVRFGELLPDDAALNESLRGRLGSLRRAFERVRDCIEVGVRMYDCEPLPNEQLASGRDYMRRRAETESRRREAVDVLHRQLGLLARDARIRGGTVGERERFTGSYLIRCDLVDEVRTAIETFATGRDDLTVVCTGPWAPFSFVEDVA
jgi:hypothetical protein